MAELVDALVSNTSEAIHLGSIPSLGTVSKQSAANKLFAALFLFIAFHLHAVYTLFVLPSLCFLLAGEVYLPYHCIAYKNRILFPQRQRKTQQSRFRLSMTSLQLTVIFSFPCCNIAAKRALLKKSEINGKDKEEMEPTEGMYPSLAAGRDCDIDGGFCHSHAQGHRYERHHLRTA
jgi:hypothetical protein